MPQQPGRRRGRRARTSIADMRTLFAKVAPNVIAYVDELAEDATCGRAEALEALIFWARDTGPVGRVGVVEYLGGQPSLLVEGRSALTTATRQPGRRRGRRARASIADARTLFAEVAPQLVTYVDELAEDANCGRAEALEALILWVRDTGPVGRVGVVDYLGGQQSLMTEPRLALIHAAGHEPAA